MAVTTFYLRQGTAESVTTAPSAFLGTWTVHSAAGNGTSAKSLQQVAGASVLTVAVTTTAASDTAIQQYLSAPLAAQTIAAATWTVGFVLTGTVHNYQPRIYIGVVNGATGALRGSITAAAAVAVGTGTRVVTTKLTAYSATITGSAVTVTAGDYLVVEIGATPSTSASTTLTAYADGATSISTDSATNATPASFVQCPNTLTLQAPTGGIAVVNNVSTASGLSCQTHMAYAVNSARWWVFWFDSGAMTTIRCASSPDLVTWTFGAEGTLAQTHGNEGRNFSVAYANISSTDVLHLVVDHNVAGAANSYFLRATVSDTTLTWGTETVLTNGGLVSTEAYTGSCTGIASTGLVYQSSGYMGSSAGHGNLYMANSGGTDSGAAWAPGTWADSKGTTVTTAGIGNADVLYAAADTLAGSALVPLNSGAMLVISSNSVNTFPQASNLIASTGTTSSWITPVGVLATAFTTNFMGPADWGWAARSTSDVHVLLRNPTGGAFTHARFNGTDWTTVPGDSVPTHTSIGGSATSTGGIALTTDGTSVWAFIIDSAAGNSIYSCQWTSGSGWDAWALVLGTSATRQFLACAQSMVNGATLLLWTEGAASPYTLMALAFSAPVSSVVIPHPVVVRQAANRAAVY